MIKKPPVPPELLQVFNETFVRSEGDTISLSEWYRRDNLIPALEKIGAQPTWHLQRAECFRAILAESHWRNWKYCYDKARTQLGKNIILGKLKEIWQGKTDEELVHYLFQFYIVTLTTAAALTVIGQTFYKLDGRKELEIQLYNQYQRDIMQLDTAVMDIAYDSIVDDDNEGAAMALAEWKDVKLNPIAEQMYRHLSSAKDQIIQDGFDIEDFKRISNNLQKQKAALAAELS